MTTTQRVYSADSDTRVHVFEPLGGFGQVAHAGAAQSAPELEQLKQQAFAAGVEAGKQAAIEHCSSTVEAMTKAAEQFHTQLAGIQESLKHQILGLSMAIARQVVMSELTTNPESIGGVLEQLLDDAEGRNVYAVRLNPDDLELINELPVAETLAQTDVQLRSDPEIERGGCIIETGFGRLDAQIETRLSEMSEALLGSQAEVEKEEIQETLNDVSHLLANSENAS
jgi:flagellar assembly protein FliH